jgi:cell division protein FtsX
LGTNPLKNSVDIYLNADFVTSEKIKALETDFLKNAFIADVSYDNSLIALLNKNIKKLAFG